MFFFSSFKFSSCSNIPNYHRCLPPLDLELLPADRCPHGLPCLRVRPAHLEYRPYSQCGQALPPSPTSAACPHQRLHEIIMRVGEICLSPELAFPILFPAHASGYTFRQEVVPPPVDALTPAFLFSMMDMDRAPSQLRDADAFFASFLQACLPAPVELALAKPLRLLAWRVETPGRTCVFTGQHPAGEDPIVVGQDFEPHMLSKALLDERSRRPEPSAIHLITAAEAPSPDHVRASLLHYAQTALTPYHERVHQTQVPSIFFETFFYIQLVHLDSSPFSH